MYSVTSTSYLLFFSYLTDEETWELEPIVIQLARIYTQVVWLYFLSSSTLYNLTS